MLEQKLNLFDFQQAFISKVEEDPDTGCITLRVEHAETHQQYKITLSAQLSINQITFTSMPVSVLGPDGRYTNIGPCLYSRVDPVVAGGDSAVR